MLSQYYSSFFLIRVYCFCLDIIYSIVKLLVGEKYYGDAKTYNKILVSNIAHLGDVLYSLRVVALLKERYPKAKIDFICGSWSLPLVESCSDIDNVYVIDHWKLNRKNMGIVSKIFISISTWMKTFLAIRGRNYDVGIDFYVMYPSMSDLFYLAGIPKRIGYTSGGGGVLLTNKIYFPNVDKHIMELNAECVYALSVDISNLGYAVANIRKNKQATAILQRFDITDNYFYVFHYGSGEPKREWSPANWIKLLDCLANENITIFMTGSGKREKNIIDDIVSSTKNRNVISLCNMLSISELFMVISHAELFIGCESFAGHIAGMYKVKQVSIMHGATKKVMWQPYSNQKCVVLRADIDCLECQAPRKCKYNHKCMNIEVEAVLNAIATVER